MAAFLLAGALALAHGHHASTLGKAKHYPVDGPDQLREIGIAQMDGDSRSDIVVTDNLNLSAWVLHGRKNGFSAATEIPLGSVAHGLALGKLNAGNRADVVSAGAPLSVTVDDHGYTTGSYAYNADGVALGDLNGDHHLDVVASGDNVDSVGVILNSGTSVIAQPVQPYPTGANPIAVAVSRIDGDEHPDVAVLMNQAGVGAELQVMHGSAIGALSSGSIRILEDTNADGMTTGDFNGDGRLDYAVTQGCVVGEPHRVLMVLGKKGGFGVPKPAKAPAGICGDEPAAADVNGDGNLDVLAAQNNGSDEGKLAVFFGNGKGGLSKAKQFPAVSSAQSVAAGRLNGDKRPDAVVPDSNTTKVAVLYGKKR